MRTVDTALESWDIEFFKNKILGTIGVLRLSLEFHLWVKLVHFPSIFILVQTCYDLGTMSTPMVPKFFSLKSMISELSNAVSHIFLRLLKISVRNCKVWDFFVIFKWKVIFSKIHQIRVKNHVFPEGVDSDLERLWKRLIRL